MSRKKLNWMNTLYTMNNSNCDWKPDCDSLAILVYQNLTSSPQADVHSSGRWNLFFLNSLQSGDPKE